MFLLQVASTAELLASAEERGNHKSAAHFASYLEALREIGVESAVRIRPVTKNNVQNHFQRKLETLRKASHDSLVTTVRIAVRDHTLRPGSKNEGEFTGDQLRELLAPMLMSRDLVIVDLDGTGGYSASFLKAAFVELVPLVSTRIFHLDIVSDDEPSLRDEIWSYIYEALDRKLSIGRPPMPQP